MTLHNIPQAPQTPRSYERTPEEVRRIEAVIAAIFGEDSPLQRSILTPQQALAIARMLSWADYLEHKYPERPMVAKRVRELAHYLLLSRVAVKGMGHGALRIGLQSLNAGGNGQLDAASKRNFMERLFG